MNDIAQTALPGDSPGAGVRRLFLALWPDDAVRRRIAAHVGHWSWTPESVRYASGDWHVTLHFLGRVSADQVDGLANGANLDFDPFECVLDRPQIWGRGLAVLCPSEVPAPWLALHDRLGLMLGGLGFPSDPRSYRPHLTLARHAAGASPPQRQMPITWPVRSFALVASTGHDNPRYEVVRVYDQTA